MISLKHTFIKKKNPSTKLYFRIKFPINIICVAMVVVEI